MVASPPPCLPAAARDRLRRARQSLPRPLLFLLIAVGVVGAAWALFVPPFQAPDENSHFGYAQRLAESFELPGDADRKVFSTEQDLAQDCSNSDQVAGILADQAGMERAGLRPLAVRRRRGCRTRRATTAAGPNPAATNPPLYYLYELPAYLAASGGDMFDRLYVMRLWSVLLLLVTTAATWLLAGELFGPRPAAAAGRGRRSRDCSRWSPS